MLLGSGGPQLDVLLGSSPQGIAGQAVMGLGGPVPTHPSSPEQRGQGCPRIPVRS